MQMNDAMDGAGTNDEAKRLIALQRLHILDTPEETAFDHLVELATVMTGASHAMINFIDGERQWTKAAHGAALLPEASSVPREQSLCELAMRHDGLMIVGDLAGDPRFADSPRGRIAGVAPFRFYAGAPLVSADGEPLGALCVADNEPRHLNAEQQRSLLSLARQVTLLLEARRATHELKQSHAELARTVAQLRQSIGKDELTNLMGPSLFYERLNDEAERLSAEGKSLSVILVDLDRFKQYNDAFGRVAGDRMLEMVAYLLVGSVRLPDMVARLAGEEFAILLPSAGSTQAQTIAESIRENLFHSRDLHRPLSVSIGVATEAPYVRTHAPIEPELAMTLMPPLKRLRPLAERLLSRAEHALSLAQRAGGNRVVFAN